MAEKKNDAPEAPKPDPAPKPAPAAKAAAPVEKKREETYQLSPVDFSGATENQLDGQIGFLESKLKRAHGEEKLRLKALIIQVKNERGKRWAKLPGWKDGATSRPVPPWEAEEKAAREAEKKAAKTGPKGGVDAQVTFKG